MGILSQTQRLGCGRRVGQTLSTQATQPTQEQLRGVHPLPGAVFRANPGPLHAGIDHSLASCTLHPERKDQPQREISAITADIGCFSRTLKGT